MFTSRARLQTLLLITLAGPIALVGLAGCIVNDHPLKTHLAPDVRRPDTAAILFYIDAFGNDVLDRHIQARDIPNIQRYILDRGLRYRRTVTCMPSITYAATATFLTGQSPGYHNIVGNRWFDPYSMRYQAYDRIHTYRAAQKDFITPTIFEVLHDQFTVSIQVATRRGVTKEIDNWATSGINWFFGNYTNVDKLTAMRFDLIADMANKTGRWPRFIFAYFPACDETGHRFGVNSSRYDAAVRNTDEQIGRICRGLEKAGMLERTLLVLTSDHGQIYMNDGDGVIDVPSYLSKQYGIRVAGRHFEDDTDYMEQFEFYNRFDVVAVPDAPRLLGLHIRQIGGQWYDRPNDVRPIQVATNTGGITGQALVEDLVQKPYTRFIAMRAGKDTIQIVSRTGAALVHVNGPATSQPSTAQLYGAKDILYRYEILQGQDPLNLGMAELATSTNNNPPACLTLPGSQWLARTIDSPNPGVVSQIATYFYSTRAGDIVVFAEPGYGFGPDKSGHGSTTPQEMRVPLVFAGKDIQPGQTDEPTRIQSIMPTIVTALGFGDRLNMPLPLDGPVLDVSRAEPRP